MADSYLDKINRREVEIQAFANYLIKEYTEKGVVDAYRAARLALLDVGDITSRSKLNKIVAEINRSVNPIYSDMWSDITGELDNFGAAEAVFAAKTLSEFSPVNIKTPAKKKTQEYIQRAIMSLKSGTKGKVTAGLWSDFVKRNTDGNTKLIVDIIKSDHKTSTTNQMISRIKMVSNGVTKKGTDILVRTGAAHYSQQANEYLAEDNSGILDRSYPITTWDSRRSVVCTKVESAYGVDGSISDGWPYGKSPIGLPPYHYGCRTIVRHLPKGVELEGDRPAVEGRKGEAAEKAFDRKKVKKYRGRKDRAFKADQIPVDTKLSRFILNQPIWYQNQLLGVTKAKAFRAGKLDLSKLTDRQLRPLNLDELGLD